ncbi:MAG: hypothetical protein Q8P41_15280 [Pseudomonadota bacterium]|nr:hypothetical protein [Pseudomonadota bacterium]
MRHFFEVEVHRTGLPAGSPRALVFRTIERLECINVKRVTTPDGADTSTLLLEFVDSPCPYSVVAPGRTINVGFDVLRAGQLDTPARVLRRWEEAASYDEVQPRLQLPPAWVHLEFHAELGRAECEWLRMGHTPLRMEDHWGAVAHAEELLYYRSWTGLAVFRIVFAGVDDTLSARAEVSSSAPAWCTSDLLRGSFEQSRRDYRRIRDTG